MSFDRHAGEVSVYMVALNTVCGDIFSGSDSARVFELRKLAAGRHAEDECRLEVELWKGG